MNKLSFLAKRGNLISVTVAGEGMPLILLHGFPLDHRLWLQQFDYLSKNYCIIAPDLRGFGQSTLTEEPYSMADLAEDVEQVRQHMTDDQPVALCGLSMGGYVAFEYWRHYSKSLTALILANTKPEEDTDQGRAARRAMSERAHQLGSWHAVSEMLPKLLSEQHFAQLGSQFQAAEQMLRSCSADAVSSAQRAMADRADFIALLPALSTPTLVITGEEDTIAPPAATRKWAAVIPNSQCHVLAGAAHLTPLEQPQQFNQLVHEFLGSL
ncbi:MAG: alpha/beta hydrolase [Pirellulaceae bacterium]|nr:alpha/beta hydrolase [Pirellulaceae bacterium]